MAGLSSTCLQDWSCFSHGWLISNQRLSVFFLWVKESREDPDLLAPVTKCANVTKDAGVQLSIILPYVWQHKSTYYSTIHPNVVSVNVIIFSFGILSSSTHGYPTNHDCQIRIGETLFFLIIILRNRPIKKLSLPKTHTECIISICLYIYIYTQYTYMQ